MRTRIIYSDAGERIYVEQDGNVLLNNIEKRDAGYYVIPDIQPYQATATDIATGKAPVIAGRRQHREFLRRNEYVEIGNEKMNKSRDIRGDFNVRKELTQAVKQVLRK